MDTRKIEESLAERYEYKKLPQSLSELAIRTYRENLPSWINELGSDSKIFTVTGTLLSKGYRRVVIGDYGAFIEFDKTQANKLEFIVEQGQEYRISNPKYKNNVKYHWYTIDDNSGIKIYLQQKRVVYADYLPGMYYVSPHEVIIKEDDV